MLGTHSTSRIALSLAQGCQWHNVKGATRSNPGVLRLPIAPHSRRERDVSAVWEQGRCQVPRISVIVPVRDAEATLDETLASIASQSLGDWEAVVVDDGSADESLAIARAWARREGRIVVLTHPGGENLGRGATRNTAIAAARSEFCAFLDADDALLPDALASYLEAFGAHPEAGVVYGQAAIFGDGADGALCGRGTPGASVRLGRQLARFNVLATCATAARRVALVASPFPAHLRFPIEDWACWLGLARGWAFVFVARVLARYRRHAGSGTGAVLAGGLEPECDREQAAYLRATLGAGTREERAAAREGARFRATCCLRQSISALRSGGLTRSARWLGAAIAVAGDPATFAAALARVVPEQRRIRRGEDPPLAG